ncbi:glycerol-3-phosphate acyltransferase PlsY [Spiroplasma corruscae]|uniref:Glycerol-3-phosphate acyltransferase n=1 Tax=Spiroplasma corruscae TaxID=216934 RepID=A0A222EPR4_9MOLU|nr:glycerol-3-phosphate 1-O-acyltransferase PlsY [Spiroplasma corruscae]ASP28264.1 glycerol-3-phosphate acyltransferase PlsY [Spiroplasma corruscae]
MYLGTFIASLIGYLIGSFTFSIIVVKIKTSKDIREIGSNNAGATNTSRVLGLKWGIIVLILDSLKVLLTAIIAMLINMINNDLFNKTSFYIPMFFTLIGHCWPIYYKFKGGKAVSCFMGLLLVTNYILFILFLTFSLTIFFIFKKVSLASIIGSLIICILTWIPYISGHYTFDINGWLFFTNAYNNNLYFVWFNKFHDLNKKSSFYDSFLTINIVLTLSTVFLIVRHRKNIVRLFKGKEPNFGKKVVIDEKKHQNN